MRGWLEASSFPPILTILILNDADDVCDVYQIRCPRRPSLTCSVTLLATRPSQVCNTFRSTSSEALYAFLSGLQTLCICFLFNLILNSFIFANRSRDWNYNERRIKGWGEKRCILFPFPFLPFSFFSFFVERGIVYLISNRCRRRWRMETTRVCLTFTKLSVISTFPSRTPTPTTGLPFSSSSLSSLLSLFLLPPSLALLTIFVHFLFHFSCSLSIICAPVLFALFIFHSLLGGLLASSFLRLPIDPCSYRFLY